MKPWLVFAAVLATSACASVSFHDPVTSDPATLDAAFPASMTSIAVMSDGARLNGIVYVAQGAGPHPLVVLLHGYPGDERNLDLAQAVRRSGWNVLFFHYRGAWGSEGRFSFGHALEDVAAALALAASPEFAREHRIDPGRIALVGHSMGGFLALTVGSGHDAVDCVASISGANLGVMARGIGDPELAASLARRLDAISGPIRGAGGAALVAELAAHPDAFDTTLRAGGLAPKALLLVAGARDGVAPPEIHHDPLVSALESASAARLDAVVLNSDHAYSDRRIALTRRVVRWLDEQCTTAD